MNPWEQISGAICFNIFDYMVDYEITDVQQLIRPLDAVIYVANNWDQINFSKTDSIESLRPFVNISSLKIMELFTLSEDALLKLIMNRDNPKEYSFMFSYYSLNALKEYNKIIFEANPKLFFQMSWEVLFWLIIDKKIPNIMKTIADYTDEDIEIYNELINRINELNPLCKL